MYKTLLKSENSSLYIIVLLIEGYLTLSIEILSIRQLTPFVGNSIIPTSLIIGIFLLALACGYHQGGRHKDNHHSILVKNFIISFYLCGIGLSYIFITLIFNFLRQYIGLSPFIALCIYLLFITAPLIYCLGQTVPLVMGLMHNKSHTSVISGFVLNISTIGSFLGSVLTSVLFLNYFGVAATVFINLLLLTLLISIFVHQKHKILSLLVLSLIGGYLLNVNFEHNFFIETNSYANYRIENLKDKKYLLINESISSVISKDGKGAKYIQLINNFLFNEQQLQNKEIVVLGAGGFTLTSGVISNDNNVLYVDIDPSIKRIVEENNYINQVQGEFIGQDARYFISNTAKKFDVVISDAYSNKYTIPFHLLTREYFKAINSALNNNGIAIFNIIASATFVDDYSKNIDQTIRSVFQQCRTTPLSYSNEYTNIIYICFRTSSNPSYIYSDNLNTAPLDLSY